MSRFTNPTGTGNTERAWRGDINRRWTEFTKRTTSQLRTANGLVTNAETFQMSAGQIRTFMEFYRLQMEDLLLGSDPPDNWQNKYQLEAYHRGAVDARRSLIAQGAQILPTGEEIVIAAGLSPTLFTAVPSIGTAGAGPIHRDALQFLFTRSFESLNGWTDALARETRQILMSGVSEGKGIDEIVRDMRDRINVSRTRARVIAQTEVIQAYQHATANETERAEIETGETFMIRWMTVRDNKVRHLHALWHGVLLTVKEYRRRIGISPWNCRCGSGVVIPEADTPAKREKFKKERKMLLILQSTKGR